MALTLYYLSGSPYAWRVWLSLEHKGIDYDFKSISFDGGDFDKPEFVALNPRRRVPVLMDDGFVLYESAAIVEYLSDKWPEEPRLLSADLRQRAIQRRMIREADQYVGDAVERLVRAILFTPMEKWSEEKIAAARAALKTELALWETMVTGEFLAGALSAVDFTLFPYLALVERMGMRKPGLAAPDLMGPKLTAWSLRMKELPVTRKTWPPHWR
jgi:glutathione S-transferase